MNIDRWIGVIGIALAVAGILLAIHFYRKTVRTKVLAIGYTAAIPLALSDDGAHRTRHHSFVLLWNRGSAPVETSDFIAPITVPDAALVGLDIYEQDRAADVAIETPKHRLKVDLLRPGEAVILQLATTGKPDRLSLLVQMKAPDMSVPFRGLWISSNIFAIALAIFVMLSFFGALAYIATNANETLETWYFNPVLLTSMGPVIAAAISYYGPARIDSIRNKSLSPVVMRFISLRRQTEDVSSLAVRLGALLTAIKKK